MPNPRELADQLVKNVEEILSSGGRVFVGLNSYIPLIASLITRDLYGKRLKLFSVAETVDPRLEGYKLTYSTGDHNIASMGVILPTFEAFDMAQKGLIDVMFLGPLQVDAETNFNLSAIGDYWRPKVRLTGGAASAFIAPLVKKLVLWVSKHSLRSLVSRVDFVTATAKYSNNEIWLVTNLCVMKYDRNLKAWRLEAVNPWVNVEEVKRNTGFPIIIGDLKISQPPTREEVEFIERLDPDGLRLSPFY